MKNLNFESGIKEYAVNGDESRVIRICVTDMNLPKRIADLESEVDRLHAKYSGIGAPDAQQLYELDREVRTIIDKAFGRGVSDAAFGTVNCCSPVGGGRLLFMGFIEALSAQIKADIEAAFPSRISEKAAEYLA